MDQSEQHLRLEMERLHHESFGWALACCRHNREEAAETLQTVYLKVLEKRARFEGHGEFKSWLFGVIRRTASERRRKEWRRTVVMTHFQETPLSTKAEEIPDPSDLAHSHERTEQFRTLLAQLPDRQREVLHLVYYHDLTITEAARSMEVSVGSARKHYHRAKKRLGQLLSENDKSTDCGNQSLQDPITDGN